MKIAHNSPSNINIERSLRIEISSVIRILKISMEEKNNIEKEVERRCIIGRENICPKLGGSDQ